jgi:hypothetical protein
MAAGGERPFYYRGQSLPVGQVWRQYQFRVRCQDAPTKVGCLVLPFAMPEHMLVSPAVSPFRRELLVVVCLSFDDVDWHRARADLNRTGR